MEIENYDFGGRYPACIDYIITVSERITKTKRMTSNSFLFPMLIAALGFAFLNCSGDKHAHGDDHEHAYEHVSETGEIAEASGPQFEVDQRFQQQLSAVFTAYVDLQKALVASNPESVQQEAAETATALNNVDISLVSGLAQNDWKSYQQDMASSLQSIGASDDLEAQRESFRTLSDALYKSAKAFGLDGKEAYHTYCPMAFNNEGASWLSDQKEVRNPYFGDKMLKCGVVKEKLN